MSDIAQGLGGVVLKASTADNATRHGHARHAGGKASPTYHSWLAMRARCRLDGRHNSDRYKGKGIVVCDRWSLFENFLEDLGERPPGTSLDRINSDGNYEPANCRWATPREQARNTRHTKLNHGAAVQIAVRRLSGERCRTIAFDYGVSENLPREIVKGRCWPDALEEARRIVNGD